MEILNLRENENLEEWGIQRTASTKLIVLGDKTNEYDVYRIPVERLAYNLNNGRMYMEVRNFESEEEIKLEDIKKLDVARFNDEIETLIWSTNEERNTTTMKDIFKYGQLEPGVVLDDGTVIDGNRRFTCIRKLHREYPEDERFKYFNAALVRVDGQNITRELLKKYELKVQFGVDEKLSYNTINMYMSIYELVEKTKMFDYTTVADLVGKKTNDILKIVNTCRLVDEFLAYIKRKEKYAIAENFNIYWPLEPLAAYLKKNDKNLSELEKVSRKNLFFDYLLTLDIELATQSLRSGLINKIFSKPELTEMLIDKHNELMGDLIHGVIDTESDVETFIQSIKALTQTPQAKEDNQVYREMVDRLTVSNQIDLPLKACKHALESLESVNIKALLDNKNEKTEEILNEIRIKLDKIIEQATQIKLEIENYEE